MGADDLPCPRNVRLKKALARAKGRSLGNRLRSNRRVGRVKKLRAVEDQSAPIPKK